MKKIIIGLSLAIFVIFTPQKIYSHAGGGPPFVKVNGEYAETNPLFDNAPESGSLTIPQDITGGKYVVNTPISLSIDTERMSQFGLTKEAAESTVYRWKVFKGWNYQSEVSQAEEGETVTKTFQSPGTYLVSLEVKPPQDTDFTLMDTISLHVLKNSNTPLPFNTVTITSEMRSEKPTEITLSTKGDIKEYIFAIDGEVKRRKTIIHTYSQEYYYDVLVARTVTEQGLIADTGILVVADGGKLSFSLLDPSEPKQNLTVTAKQNFSNLLIIFGIINALLVTVALFIVRKRKRK